MSLHQSAHAKIEVMHFLKSRTRGFTIVELLIVVVVIAILASIVIVAYNGIQQKARNTARVQTVVAIQKSMLLYEADNGKGSLYPILMTINSNAQCIGRDYDDVDPSATHSCRYAVYDNATTDTTPINQPLYDALRTEAQYRMNYTPVVQRNFLGVTSITSSAPFITPNKFTDTGKRYTLDGGPLRDYYILMSYRLEGVDQNCQLPVVRQTSQTATQANFTSGFPYSVTYGGATECWIWLDW